MKKVRYLVGVAGVAPAAFGLVGQAPPAVAATHTAKPVPTALKAKHGKTVYIHPDSGCTGSTKRQHTVYSSQKKNFVVLGFWSTHHGAKTCIGTIYVNGGGDINYVGGWVSGADGQLYCEDAGKPNIEYGCHGSFYTPFSVRAFGSTASGCGCGDSIRVGSKVG